MDARINFARDLRKKSDAGLIPDGIVVFGCAASHNLAGMAGGAKFTAPFQNDRRLSWK
jgi:hypothetical protein